MAWRSSRFDSSASPCPKRTSRRYSSRCAPSGVNSRRSSEAEGEREASRIRSEAELEAARIRAKGAEEEARIRGESAAQVAKTYADAHRIDPELYRFTRSLDSLDKLVTGNTSLILRTDSEPFSLLQSK